VKRIVVTGAAGFIGSNLCEALIDRGHVVTGVDNFDPFYERATKERWLKPLLAQPNFRFFESDVCAAAGSPEWIKDVSAVIHLAALAGVRTSVSDAARYMAVNVGGTTSVLEACRNSGVRQVVVASSSSVYGERGGQRFDEAETGLEPVSPYGVSKYAGELISQMYARLHGFRVAALRFFSVYGPRQRPDQAIFTFRSMISAGEPIECFGDGSTARDYTHVDDVVAGILGALDWVGDEAADYQVFNIGSGRSVLLKDLLEMLGQVVGGAPKVREVKRPAVDVSCTFATIEKAAAILGYAPQVRLEDGLAQFNEWYEVTYGHQRSSVA